jgi:hypothetical protein
MKITLPPELLKKIASSLNVFNIKILKVKSESSIISILNKSIEVPVKLDKNKNYTAEIKEGEIFIKEVLKKEVHKSAEGSKLESVMPDKNEKAGSDEQINLLLNDFFKKIILDDKEKNKNNFALFGAKDDFYFIFDHPVYSSLSKVFIKVDKDKNTFVNILSGGKISGLDEKELSLKLKKRVQNKCRINLAISADKENFYNKIFSMINLKNIDINI